MWTEGLLNQITLYPLQNLFLEYYAYAWSALT